MKFCTQTDRYASTTQVATNQASKLDGRGHLAPLYFTNTYEVIISKKSPG